MDLPPLVLTTEQVDLLNKRKRIIEPAFTLEETPSECTSIVAAILSTPSLAQCSSS
jgi:hypothetical protein